MKGYIKKALLSSCVLYSEKKLSEELFLDVVKSLLIESYKPDLSNYPSGSSIPLPPPTPNDRIIREDGKQLVNPNLRKK